MVSKTDAVPIFTSLQSKNYFLSTYSEWGTVLDTKYAAIVCLEYSSSAASLKSK